MWQFFILWQFFIDILNVIPFLFFAADFNLFNCVFVSLAVASSYFPILEKILVSSYFLSLIVEILLWLVSSLSLPFEDKTQWFVYFKFQRIKHSDSSTSSFNSNLKLINSTSSNLQKILRYCNDTAIAVLLKIPFAPSGSVFPYNLAIYLEDLKALFSAI